MVGHVWMDTRAPGHGMDARDVSSCLGTSHGSFFNLLDYKHSQYSF